MLGAHTLMTDTLMADMLMTDMLVADTLVADTLVADTLGWLLAVAVREESPLHTQRSPLLGFLLIVSHGLGHPSLYVLYAAAVARVVAEYCV